MNFAEQKDWVATIGKHKLLQEIIWNLVLFLKLINIYIFKLTESLFSTLLYFFAEKPE